MSLGFILGTGLGQGVGQAGAAIEQARKDALARQQFDRQQGLAESTIAHQREMERLTNQRDMADPTPFLPALKAGGLDLSQFTGPMRTGVLEKALGVAETNRARTEETSARTQAADVIRRAPGTPSVGSQNEPEGFVAGTPAMAPNDIKAAFMGIKNGGALYKQMYPEDSFASGPTGIIYNKHSGEVTQPGKPKTSTYHVNTAQGVIERIVDDTGNVISERRVGDLPPHPPKEPPQQNQTQAVKEAVIAYQGLRDNPQFGPGHPQTKRAKELAIALSQAVPTQPGGDVQSKINFLSDEPMTAPAVTAPAAPSLPQAPGAATPGPKTSLQGPPRAPDAAHQTKLAELDAALSRTDSLLQQAEKNKALLGGVISNTTGAMRRGLSNYVPGITSPDEKKFLADFGKLVAEERRRLLGTAQTVTELKSAASYLPDTGNVDESVVAALTAARDDIKRNRDALGNVLSQGRRDVPKPIGTPTMSPADAKAAAKFGL